VAALDAVVQDGHGDAFAGKAGQPGILEFRDKIFRNSGTTVFKGPITSMHLEFYVGTFLVQVNPRILSTNVR
jgi:hypothetical protein